MFLYHYIAKCILDNTNIINNVITIRYLNVDCIFFILFYIRLDNQDNHVLINKYSYIEEP